jgi:hypothetical protein
LVRPDSVTLVAVVEVVVAVCGVLPMYGVTL